MGRPALLFQRFQSNVGSPAVLKRSADISLIVCYIQVTLLMLYLPYYRFANDACHIIVHSQKVALLHRLPRETVPSQTSDMGRETVSVIGLSFLLP